MTGVTGGMDFNRLISLAGVMIVVMIVIAAVAGVYLLFIKPMMEESGFQEDYRAVEAVTPGVSDSAISAPRTTGKGVSSSTGSASSVSGTVTRVNSFMPDDPDYYEPEITSLGSPADEPSVEKLRTIFHKNGVLLNYTALSYNVEVPKGPLYICFKVYPDIEYSWDSDDDRPDAYFTYMYMNVYDLDTGELVADEGYLKQYSSDTEKEIMIYRDGDFRIDIYGRKVTIDFAISTGA